MLFTLKVHLMEACMPESARKTPWRELSPSMAFQSMKAPWPMRRFHYSTPTIPSKPLTRPFLWQDMPPSLLSTTLSPWAATRATLLRPSRLIALTSTASPCRTPWTTTTQQRPTHRSARKRKESSTSFWAASRHQLNDKPTCQRPPVQVEVSDTWSQHRCTSTGATQGLSAPLQQRSVRRIFLTTSCPIAKRVTVWTVWVHSHPWRARQHQLTSIINHRRPTVGRTTDPTLREVFLGKNWARCLCMEYELPQWCKRGQWTLHHHRGDTTTTRMEEECTVHSHLGILQPTALRLTLNWCPGLQRGAPVAGKLFKEVSMLGTSTAFQMIPSAPLFSQPIACPTSPPQPRSETLSSPLRHSTCSCSTWTQSIPTCPSPTVHLLVRTTSVHPRRPSPKPLQDPHTKQTQPFTVTTTLVLSTTPYISPWGQLEEPQHCPTRAPSWSPRRTLLRGPMPATNTKTPPRHTPRSPTSTHAKQTTTTPSIPPLISTSRCR